MNLRMLTQEELRSINITKMYEELPYQKDGFSFAAGLLDDVDIYYKGKCLGFLRKNNSYHGYKKDWEDGKGEGGRHSLEFQFCPVFTDEHKYHYQWRSKPTLDAVGKLARDYYIKYYEDKIARLR